MSAQPRAGAAGSALGRSRAPEQRDAPLPVSSLSRPERAPFAGSEPGFAPFCQAKWSRGPASAMCACLAGRGRVVVGLLAGAHAPPQPLNTMPAGNPPARPSMPTHGGRKNGTQAEARKRKANRHRPCAARWAENLRHAPRRSGGRGPLHAARRLLQPSAPRTTAGRPPVDNQTPDEREAEPPRLAGRAVEAEHLERAPRRAKTGRSREMLIRTFSARVEAVCRRRQ